MVLGYGVADGAGDDEGAEVVGAELVGANVAVGIGVGKPPVGFELGAGV